jgi:hypothetical protein
VRVKRTRDAMPNRDRPVFVPRETVRVFPHLRLDLLTSFFRRVGRENVLTICGREGR